MLYNLQFIQALAALSSNFSPEERQAWSTAGALKKVIILESPEIECQMWMQTLSPLFASVSIHLG